MNRRFTSIYLYGEGLVNKVKKYKVAWKHTQTFSFMNPKEETGLASCYITCANKTDRQGEKVEKIKHRWNNRILDIKKRERNRKKNWNYLSDQFVRRHSSQLFWWSHWLLQSTDYQGSSWSTIHVKHFKHFSYLCFCVCFFHPGVHQVEKFSKVNDAIVLEKKM